MVSRRLDGLVEGWVQRTYLKAIDGFWADRVLTEFTFLEERGYDLAEVHFHQEGDYILYRGARGTVSLDFFPEAEWIWAEVDLAGGSIDYAGGIDGLILGADPTALLPPRRPLDRLSITRNVAFWARGLRAVADEVL